MKKLFLGLALFVAAIAPAIPVTGLPYEAVRVVSFEGEKYCSAVVIEPGKALTASHCLRKHMEIDGLPVDRITAAADERDIAVVIVPGLKCPCAQRGVRPAKGDQVIAVGFPADREGERVISPAARVRYVGPLNVEFPNLPFDPREMKQEYIVTDAAIITHGYSGGALFAIQNGEWRFIGVNAIGVPEGPCVPYVGCGKEIGSGFVPVDIAKDF